MGNWEKLENGVSQAGDEVLGKRKLVPRKPCMTNVILIECKNKFRKIGDPI